MAGPRIGNLLIREKKITEEQLEEALKKQKESGGSVGAHLIEMGFISETEMNMALARQLGVKAIELNIEELDPEVVNLIPAEVAFKFKVIAIDKDGKTLKVATADPTNTFAFDSVKLITGLKVVAMIAPDSSIRKAIDKFYDMGDSFSEVMKDFDADDFEVIEETEDEDDLGTEVNVDDAPLVRLVNSLLVDAVKRSASDIHIEPFERQIRVRFRIDGTLIEMAPLPLRLKAAVTSRLKIMSDLDISERRIPQDGRIKIKMPGKTVEFRVSTLPTLFGEKIVMRILDQTNLTLDLTKLGFQEEALENFLNAIEAPFGMVLVTGPTGSGKTTTLYSAISRINEIGTNIMTAEDPVEFNLQGINQVLIRHDVGMTFPAALKAFLRQDPNIIMVGEIRDIETGEIAVKAALTGHLVLSTIHTNDAPSTVNRLIDMGVQPFLVASSLNLVLAQRLLRKLCSNCKEPIDPTPEMIEELSLDKSSDDYQMFQKKGCSVCNHTGLKGRLGVYEVMPMSSTIRRMVIEGASTADIGKKAVEEGMMTLRGDAVEKMKQGIVDFHEVVRETMTE